MTGKNKNYSMMSADTEKAFDQNPASTCDGSCQPSGSQLGWTGISNLVTQTVCEKTTV